MLERPTAVKGQLPEWGVKTYVVGWVEPKVEVKARLERKEKLQ